MRSASFLLSSISAIAVTAAVASAQTFPRAHELFNYGPNGEPYEFRHFVRDARRQYLGSEYKYREGIFNAKLAEIKVHNGDSKQTWKKGINHFSDWTKDEFKNYNRARPEHHERARKLADDFGVKPETFEAPVGSTFNTLPRIVDYRKNTNPPVISGVKDQGLCGSCWAHSAAESMESYFALRYGQLPVLSQQQITSCTHSMLGCGGGSYVAGWLELASHGYGTKPSEAGLTVEWAYSYQDMFAPKAEKKYTSECQNITAKFPIINPSGHHPFLYTCWPTANISGYSYIKENDVDAMMSAIALIGPQSVLVAAETWADYESGILQNNYTSVASNRSWQEIDHAVQMVGYGFDNDLQLNYWIIRNTWGTNYGEQGFIRLLRNPQDDTPCGTLTGQKICGTSGVLCGGAFPHVQKVAKKSGYYF